MGCKVSIVVPFYNGIRYLEECVRSIQAQTLREIEILLVDDGSTDGSGDLADTFAKEDARIRVIHQQNAGPSAARNSGVDAAGGEYVGFVDADDVIAPTMYEKLYETAQMLSCEIVTCAWRSFREDRILALTEPHLPMHTRLSPEEIYAQMPRLIGDGSLSFTWRYLYAAALLRENNIRYDLQLRIGEDAVFNMECLLRADGVAAIPDCLYFYRYVPDSLARSKQYKPDLTAQLQRQYALKKMLAQTYMPDEMPAVMAALADYTYRHISRLIFMNVFRKPDKRYREFRGAMRAPIIREMFLWMDLNACRSKSLDWLLFKCVQLRLYFPAYCIGRWIFGKDK